MKKFVIIVSAFIFAFTVFFAASCKTQAENKTDIGNQPETKDKIVYEVDAPEMVSLSYWHFTSGVPENAITLKSDKTDGVFIVSTEIGEVFNKADKKYCQQAEITSGQTTYWRYLIPYNPWTDSSENNFKSDFIKITLKDGDKFSGYSLIKVTKDDNIYIATILKSVTLVDENGDTATVSEEKLNEFINEVKNNVGFTAGYDEQ